MRRTGCEVIVLKAGCAKVAEFLLSLILFSLESCFCIRIMLTCLFLYTYLPSELGRNSSLSAKSVKEYCEGTSPEVL